MKKQSKRVLAIGTAAIAVVLGVGVISAGLRGNMFLRSDAEVVNGSITFSTSTGTRTSLGSNTYATNGLTNGGYTIYAYSVFSSNPTTSSVIGKTTNSSGEVRFTSNVSTHNHFRFQNLKSISVSTNNTDMNTFLVYTSSNGESFTENSKTTWTGYLSNYSLPENTKYVYLKAHSSGSATEIVSITLNYSCDTNYVDPRVLTGLSVSGQKDSFKINDSFTFGGIASASYDDGSIEDVTDSVSVDSSAFDSSTAGDYTIYVSYQGEVTSYHAIVSVPSDLNGKVFTATGVEGNYSNKATLTLSFTSETSGNYRVVSSNYDALQYFTWAESNGSVTFTYASGSTSSAIQFIGLKLFSSFSSGVTNSSGVYSGNTISFNVYNNSTVNKNVTLTLSV